MKRVPVPSWSCAIVVVACLALASPAFLPTAFAQSRPEFQARWQSGTPVTATGVLSVMYADDFAHARAELIHTVVEARTRKIFRLRFEGAAPAALRSGMLVTVRGRAHESEIYLAASDGSALTIQGALTTSTTTGQRTLVMVANFRDAAVSCTMQCITDTMFTNPNGSSVANLYLTDSHGQVALSGDVVGPYALDVANADPCDLGGWAAAVDAQASGTGIDLTTYQHKVYVLPSTSTCPAAGYGTIGGNPSSAWILRPDLAGVFAHELGHNLGMDHASTPTSEYDDSTDPMAISTWMLHGVNAPHRHQLGWLGASSPQVVTQSGLYDVAPLAVDPAQMSQVLLIAKPDTQEYYYLSYRTPVGFDNYIDGSFFYRLSIHRYKGDGLPARTFRLAGLTDGEQFADSINGLTVTLVSHDDNHATARVEFTAPCASAPSLNLSPQTQSGPAGAAVSYTLSVTNVDGPGCPASTFAVSDSVPAGWSGVASPTTLTLSPGTRGQAVIGVTASSAAAAGTYAVVANVVNAAQTAPLASVSGTYSVEAATDSIAPTAVSGLRATIDQKRKQIQLSWNASTDNVAVAGYWISRNGTNVGTATTTGWVDTAWSAGATYTYAVVAYDAAANVSAPGPSVTVTLSSGGRKKTP